MVPFALRFAGRGPSITRPTSIAAATLVVLALAGGRAAVSAGEIIDRVLAVVGAQVVTLSDTRAALEFGLVQPRPGADPTAEALEYLVNRQLMLSEVDRYSAPSPDPAALASRMAAARKRFATDAAFQQALARSALTEAGLKDLLGDSVRIETYLDQRFGAAAQPTPEETERYYADHPAEFTRAGKVAPFDEVQAQAVARLTAERRNFLIAEWLDRVRRRFAVSTLYTGARR
jgi:hypothetical protein